MLFCGDVDQSAGEKNDGGGRQPRSAGGDRRLQRGEFDEQFSRYQVVLLGPQVKYMLPALSARAAEQGIPVAAIDMMDYGMQRGDKVLDFALALIAQQGEPA
ncbi:hypothetical protein GGER_33830 [Serratia rubidaea]